MPIVDMPIEELRVYQGVNPRPQDFDDYWEKALKEMRETEGRIEILPADFKVPCAECFDLFFQGVGGARVHAKLLHPPKNDQARTRPHPAVIMFHGYSGSAGDWQSKLAYTALGYTVAALDCRGQGGRSEDTGGVIGNTLRGHVIRGLEDHPDKLLFRQIFLDTAQLTHLVMNMEEVDEKRIGVQGGSQGGGLTLACAALVPGVKRAAARYPFLSDYKRVWEMDLAKGAYEELAVYFRHFDPTHSREDDVFKRLGYIDVQNLASRIEAEVLMGTGLMDEICPPSTQFAAYNKIKSAKNMIIYPDFGHELLPDFDDRTFQFMMGL